MLTTKTLFPLTLWKNILNKSHIGINIQSHARSLAVTKIPLLQRIKLCLADFWLSWISASIGWPKSQLHWLSLNNMYFSKALAASDGKSHHFPPHCHFLSS